MSHFSNVYQLKSILCQDSQDYLK